MELPFVTNKNPHWTSGKIGHNLRLEFLDYTFGMYPHYHHPASFVLPIVRDWALGRRRSFLADGRRAARLLGGALHYSGLEHIPLEGPLLVSHNHYSRPGFGVWWLEFVIAAALPRETHLVMTAELTRWFQPWGGRLSRFALPRIAKMYGFTTMPPVPPRPRDVAAQADSVRRVLKVVREQPNVILTVAPEGRDNLEGGSLAPPPKGAGRFQLLLAERGLRILPAAGWESDAALNVRFGSPYELWVEPGLSSVDKDRAATAIVMARIAGLMPQYLRGTYSGVAAPEADSTG
jgi:1-acyl-sn-glycerol-3-phosphate acyltransferase